MARQSRKLPRLSEFAMVQALTSWLAARDDLRSNMHLTWINLPVARRQIDAIKDRLHHAEDRLVAGLWHRNGIWIDPQSRREVILDAGGDSFLLLPPDHEIGLVADSGRLKAAELANARRFGGSAADLAAARRRVRDLAKAEPRKEELQERKERFEAAARAFEVLRATNHERPAAWKRAHDRLRDALAAYAALRGSRPCVCDGIAYHPNASGHGFLRVTRPLQRPLGCEQE